MMEKERDRLLKDLDKFGERLEALREDSCAQLGAMLAEMREVIERPIEGLAKASDSACADELRLIGDKLAETPGTGRCGVL